MYTPQSVPIRKLQKYFILLGGLLTTFGYVYFKVSLLMVSSIPYAPLEMFDQFLSSTLSVLREMRQKGSAPPALLPILD